MSSSLTEEKHDWSLAERQSHRIFFWSYPLSAGVFAAWFFLWGQVDQNKMWLLCFLVVLGVANSLHWGNVQYGGWRHMFDSFMAGSTAVVHEVCAIATLPVEDGVKYQSIRIVPVVGEPRLLGNNVLRGLDPCWAYLSGACMILNMLAVGSYLAGWHVHKKSGCPPSDKSVRDASFLHLLFRLWAMLAVLIVFAGDLSGLTWPSLWAGVAVIVVVFWAAHVAAWWLMVSCASGSSAKGRRAD